MGKERGVSIGLSSTELSPGVKRFGAAILKYLGENENIRKLHIVCYHLCKPGRDTIARC